MFVYSFMFAGLFASFAATASSPFDGPLVALGQRLFSDPRLSRDGTLSCSSCHQAAHAFADSKPVPIGIDGHKGTRNAPSLLTAGGQSSFFWDGRRTSLEDLVLDPVTNPREMGMPGDLALVTRLRAEPELRTRFGLAFPSSKSIEPIQVRAALAAFVRSLGSGQTPFDRFRVDPQQFPLQPEAKRGLALFDGKAGCSACHRLAGNPVRLTDDAFHHMSIGWQRIEHELPTLTKAVLRQNLNGEALGRRVTEDQKWAALGRFVVTHKPADLGAFRTPSLRNVAVTAPYMHDGSVTTLSDAVDVEVYYRSLASGRPLNLSVEERRLISVFLEALTDARFGG